MAHFKNLMISSRGVDVEIEAVFAHWSVWISGFGAAEVAEEVVANLHASVGQLVRFEDAAPWLVGHRIFKPKMS